QGSAATRQVPPRRRGVPGRRRRSAGAGSVTMELNITTLDGEAKGSVSLSDDIFGLEPRQDLIQRCIVWQLAKRRAGTHAVKNRADISRGGKKIIAQKGTGTRRHRSGF